MGILRFFALFSEKNELFEKKKSVKVPEWLKDDYEKKINKRVKRKEE